jgi:peptidoglycan L-alanyl-D-glutamate endopeptidase CwlK
MTFTRTPRTNKILEKLDPYARVVITEMLGIAHSHGINIQLHSGLRTAKEQDALYAQGRTKPGKVVTNAKGTPVAQSIHCYGAAVDSHFDQDEDGQAEWDFEMYKKVWALAVGAGLDKKGLRWAGNWVKFKEGPHFEVSFDKGWQDFANGFKLPKI